jgi:hypothetical protein
MKLTAAEIRIAASAITPHVDEATMATVERHFEADAACGRHWQCACGPCHHFRSLLAKQRTKAKERRG